MATEENPVESPDENSGGNGRAVFGVIVLTVVFTVMTPTPASLAGVLGSLAGSAIAATAVVWGLKSVRAKASSSPSPE